MDVSKPLRGQEWVEEMKKRLDGLRLPYKPPVKKCIKDLYSRDEIDEHLRIWAQHLAAKGGNPDIQSILDWLYSEKYSDERDDFIKIEDAIKMVKSGKVLPLIILEVLEYANDVEKAAIDVVDEFSGTDVKSKALDKLNESLNVRLEVRRLEEEQKMSKSRAEGIVQELGKFGFGKKT